MEAKRREGRGEGAFELGELEEHHALLSHDGFVGGVFGAEFFHQGAQTLYRYAGELVDAEFVHFKESAVGMLDIEEVLSFSGFKHCKSQDHRCVECHLTNGPVDHCRTESSVKELKGTEERSAGFKYSFATTLYTVNVSGRGDYPEADLGPFRIAANSFGAPAVEKDQ